MGVGARGCYDRNVDMPDYLTPDYANCALITIDVQNDFTLDGAPAQIKGTKEALPNMQNALENARRHGIPIVHVIRLYNKNGENVDLCRRQLIEEGLELVRPGSKGAELVSELKPTSTIQLEAQRLLKGELQTIAENETIIYKPRWSAFHNTRLEKHLHDLGVNTLVFIGCNYPNCPRASIYAASERDFRIALIKDAISGLYPKGEAELKAIGVRLISTNQWQTML